MRESSRPTLYLCNIVVSARDQKVTSAHARDANQGHQMTRIDHNPSIVPCVRRRWPPWLWIWRHRVAITLLPHGGHGLQILSLPVVSAAVAKVGQPEKPLASTLQHVLTRK